MMRLKHSQEPTQHFSGQLLLVAAAVFAHSLTLIAATDFLPNTGDINIGAFNVKQFGVEKCNNHVVMSKIAEIVAQFDIIAIQEIRDNSGNRIDKALQQYLEKCACSYDKNCKYDYRSSDALGRNKSYKERYAFYYRPDVMQIMGTYQYEQKELRQGKLTKFERPPFAVHVSVKGSHTVPDFLFIVVHTQPRNAAKEINLLGAVYRHFKKMTRVDNALIGGDLNADCAYWKDSMNTRVTARNGFKWLIETKTATNNGKNTCRPCAYDRFIVVGNALSKYVQENSAGPFKTRTVTADVSDHYPIGVRLRHSNVQRSPPFCPRSYNSPFTRPACPKGKKSLQYAGQRSVRSQHGIHRLFLNTDGEPRK